MANDFMPNLGTPVRSGDLPELLKPWTDRIAALEAQAQGDEKEHGELLNRFKALELVVATLMTHAEAPSPILRDLTE